MSGVCVFLRMGLSQMFSFTLSLSQPVDALIIEYSLFWSPWCVSFPKTSLRLLLREWEERSMRIVNQREGIRNQFRDLGWASVSYKMIQLYCFCKDFVKWNDTSPFFEKDAALHSEHEACLTACSVCQCVRTLLHWNMQHAALGSALVTAFLKILDQVLMKISAMCSSSTEMNHHILKSYFSFPWNFVVTFMVTTGYILGNWGSKESPSGSTYFTDQHPVIEPIHLGVSQTRHPSVYVCVCEEKWKWWN